MRYLARAALIIASIAALVWVFPSGASTDAKIQTPARAPASVQVAAGPGVDAILSEVADAQHQEALRAEAEQRAVAEAEAQRQAQMQAQQRATVSVVQQPQAVVSNPSGGWPRGCTVPGTFDPGPCIPRGTCVLPRGICDTEASCINIWNLMGSGASGKYQFMPGTWAGYGGYAYAADAPEELQDERALQVWDDGRGCGHWSRC